MPYRDETDPLRIQEAILAVELAQLQRRQRAVADALAVTRAMLEGRRPPAKRGRAWGIVVLALAGAVATLFLCARVGPRPFVPSGIDLPRRTACGDAAGDLHDRRGHETLCALGH
jgi:hypothetical protein